MLHCICLLYFCVLVLFETKIAIESYPMLTLPNNASINANPNFQLVNNNLNTPVQQQQQQQQSSFSTGLQITPSQMTELNSSLTTPRSRAPIALTNAVSKQAESLIFNEQISELANVVPLSPSVNNHQNGDENDLFAAYNNGIYNLHASINGQLIMAPQNLNEDDSNDNPYMFIANNSLNSKGIC